MEVIGSEARSAQVNLTIFYKVANVTETTAFFTKKLIFSVDTTKILLLTDDQFTLNSNRFDRQQMGSPISYLHQKVQISVRQTRLHVQSGVRLKYQ